MTRWKAFRYKLEELGCRLLAAIIPRLSRRACLWVGRLLGALAYRLDRRGRTVAVANLECVFGDRFTPPDRQRLARESYQNFARTMLDLFWSSRINGRNFRDYVHVEGLEELEQIMAERKSGAVFFCVHQGNWEWASLACGFLGLRGPIVAENFKNPRLTRVFSTQREIPGHTIIPQENSLVRLLKTVKRGGQAGLLIDLNLRPSQAATVIGAFKDEQYGGAALEMCVPVLHAILAQRAGALLIPIDSHPLPDGTCRMRMLRPVEYSEHDTLQQIAQRCWERFEPTIRARPGEWLLPYKHFRYKPAAATRPYPAYANVSSKFDKLRKHVSAADLPSTRRKHGTDAGGHPIQ